MHAPTTTRNTLSAADEARRLRMSIRNTWHLHNDEDFPVARLLIKGAIKRLKELRA